jgi:hypothetical protein
MADFGPFVGLNMKRLKSEEVGVILMLPRFFPYFFPFFPYFPPFFSEF